MGICLGLQIAIIEFARDVVNMKNANSSEFDAATEFPIVALVSEWMDASGNREKRDEKSDLGGTMRLGAQDCHLVDNTLVKNIWKKYYFRASSPSL